MAVSGKRSGVLDAINGSRASLVLLCVCVSVCVCVCVCVCGWLRTRGRDWFRPFIGEPFTSTSCELASVGPEVFTSPCALSRHELAELVISTALTPKRKGRSCSSHPFVGFSPTEVKGRRVIGQRRGVTPHESRLHPTWGGLF